MGETVKANGATLLVQVDLLFRQEVGNSAAGTESRKERERKEIKTMSDVTVTLFENQWKKEAQVSLCKVSLFLTSQKMISLDKPTRILFQEIYWCRFGWLR